MKLVKIIPACSFIIMGVMAVTLLALGVYADGKREAKLAKQRPLSNAETIVREIHYVKDNRTKLCFAYIGEPSLLHGQFSFTEVSCAEIPPELIEAGR